MHETPQKPAQEIVQPLPRQSENLVSELHEQIEATNPKLIDIPGPSVDSIEELKSDEGSIRSGFFNKRFSIIGNTFVHAKALIFGSKELSDVKAPRLSVTDELRGRIKILRLAPNIIAQANTNPNAFFDAQQRVKRELKQNRSKKFGSPTKSITPNGLDIAKVMAYELLTIAPIRMLGTLALERMSQSDSDSELHLWTSNRKQVYERGLHNPTIRRLKGYSRNDLKNLSRTDISRRAPFKTDRLA